MKKNLVIFTMDGCPYCANLKNSLNELSIDFVEINVDYNQQIWEQVVQQTKQNVLPMVYFQIDDSNNGEIYIPGTHYEEEEEIINIIKEEFKGD
jgi:glutaredoxin